MHVSGLAGIAAVAVGADHSLALKYDGTVWTWGSNEAGELGDGSNTDRNTPVQVSGLAGVASFAGGAYYSVTLKSDVNSGRKCPTFSGVNVSPQH